ncbi:hypothetical protein [Cesiribacter andamanensis]|uniref:Lipocalin-like domain-containing protein n=1 Tax=Cesiribacter andamanensis AMV16 TaxID=1279009 RepID=M7NKQ7_9BACT|nr:hypothetical protein [Cesiribacter andamanensis]EMR02365.1 hypothetical protein ADICEAN_02514 [Cesiribacter andamanensis AMV16]
MKSVRHYFALLLLLPFLVLAACNNKSEENPRQLIAGESSKVWKADKETNAQGDKERLSNTEEEQRMEFYANGTFQVREAGAFQGGRWNYNATQKELELTFDDRQDVKEVFHVQELSGNKMTLHAADGSTMKLKTD